MAQGTQVGRSVLEGRTGRPIPQVLWIGLVSLGLIAFLTLTLGLTRMRADLLVSFAVDCVLFWGLARGYRWAYWVTFVLCVLGPVIVLLNGYGVMVAVVGACLNALVLVPVLVCTEFCFPKQGLEGPYTPTTEMGE